MSDGQDDLDAREGFGDIIQLPHDLVIEQNLLGALLCNNEAYFKVLDLKPEHFYEPVHGRIFAAIVEKINNNEVADPVRLKNQFKDDPDLKEIGSAAYLVRMAASATTIISTPDYGKSIIKDYTRRQIMQFSEFSNSEALNNNDMDPSEFINLMEEELHNLRPDAEKDDGKPVFSSDIFDKTIRIMEDVHSNKGLVGVSTGLHWLDERIGGFRPKRLYILAGRPGMAKTALALFFMLRAAEADHASLFFSLEMPDDQLGFRILSCLAKGNSNDFDKGIHYSNAEKGKLTYEEQNTYKDMAGLSRSLPFYVIDKGGLRLSQIRMMAMRHKRKLEKKGQKLKIIFIDFLQIIQADGRYRGNRTNEIADITMGLKNLAKELDLAVVTLSQLSRNVEQRDDKRPMLSDLRDSGSIEQDADDVLFLYRDEYYLEKKNHPMGTQGYEDYLKSKNHLEIITAKQRGGPTGTDHVYIDVATNFARNLTQDENDSRFK